MREELLEKTASSSKLGLDERFEVERVIAERETFSRYIVKDARDGARRLLEIQRVSPPDEAGWRARAELARKLHHPSLLRCLEADLVNDHHGLLVFEPPPDGLPETFSPVEVARTAVSVSSALTLLHHVGLLFGTPIIEPASWQPTSSGLVVRLEVLARSVAGRHLEPLCAQALLYAPPEIAAGEAPSPSSDLYVMGMLLYRMLVGSPPPLGEAERRPVDDDELAESVLELLAREPSRRPASAAHACDRFIRWLKSRGASGLTTPWLGWVERDGFDSRSRRYVVPVLSPATVDRLTRDAGDSADLERRLTEVIWNGPKAASPSRATVDRVRRLYRTGNVEAALRACPREVEDSLLRATLLWRNGRPLEAESSIGERTDNGAVALRARLARERGDLNRADGLLASAPLVDTSILVEKGCLSLDRGLLDEAVSTFQKAVGASTDPESEARARSARAVALARTGRIREAGEEVARGIDRLVEGEDEGELRSLRVVSALVQFEAGHFEEARALLANLMEALVRDGDRWLLQRALPVAAEIAICTGREAAAQKYIDDCLRLATERRDPAARLVAFRLQVQSQVVRGDFAGALDRMRGFHRLLASSSVSRERALVCSWAARAGLESSQPALALKWVGQGRAAAGECLDPVLSFCLTALEAIAHANDDVGGRARILFERALASVEDRSQPLVQAQLYIDFLRSSWSEKGPALAEVRRRAAVRIAQSLGAAPYLARLDVAEIGDGAAPKKWPGIIASSEVFCNVLAQVGRAAPLNVPVHLNGESGTGKELVARALHDGSPRARKAFVAVNCAAIPDALLEAELFGHTRGAFTGADRARPGLLEEADGGTLFLDEVADLSPRGQTLLLRVLQEKEYRRLGESALRRADFRLISASHRSLEDDVRAGRFREDLFFRLKVVGIRIPPLRERPDDILPTARHVLARRAEELGLPVPSLEREVGSALARYEWPGNVRELENEMTRALVRAGASSSLGVRHLSPSILGGGASEPALRQASSVLEKRLVEAALLRHRGNRTRAARDLGVTRQALYQKLKKHRLAAAS